ncbi:MAG: hypothetical protein EA361_05660, partial [Bacteroidetes bacterium]
MHARLFYFFLMFLTAGTWLYGGENYRVIRGERPVIDYHQLTEADYHKGELVIKFRADYAKHLEQNPVDIDKNGIVRFHIPQLDRLNELYGAKSAVQHFSSGAFKNGFTERHKAWGFHLWYRLELDEKADIPSVIEQYARIRELEVAEPVLVKEIIGTHNDEDFRFVDAEQLKNASKWTPNDPQFGNQWHYHNTGQQNGTPGSDISLTQAWELEKGDTAVIVAIIDGGIDYNHNDLAGNMWPQLGYNFVNDSPTIQPHNHGTHVAGTIAAVSNNNLGVAGIAGGSGENDGVRLMSCQVFTASSNGGFHIAPVYAADNGAAISQNSWGYTSPGVFEQNVLDAIDYFNVNGGGEAMDGGITIFAAGNSNSSAAYYPGYYSGCFSVAATNNQDAKSWYSNYGNWIDISAPGGETNTVTTRGVLSTLNGNQYGYYQGTSMACPHVSGVVALMLSSVYGEFSPEDVEDILINTADNHYGSNPGFIGQLGSGRLNAHTAVVLSQLYLTLPSNPSNFTAFGSSDSQIDLSWEQNDEGDNVMLAWSPNGTFGIPQEETTYQAGDNIEGGGIVLFIGDTTSFEHTNLNAATLYHYKLWSVDAEVKYSMGRTAHAYTQCGITTLPVFEPFSSGDIPYCWAFPNGQGNWKMVSGRGNPAPAIEFNWSPSITNYEFALESPPLDGNIPGSAIALEFDLWLNNYSSNTLEEMIVQVGSGNEWTDVMTFDNSGGDIPWDTYFVDITPWTLNETFMIRFKAQGENSFNLNYWVIDNFNVYSFSCPQPADLSISNLTSNSADISWEAVGEETLWDLVWGSPGFDPDTQGTLTEGLTSTSFLLEGLSIFTSYQVYVRADCGDDDLSLWHGPLSFKTLATCPAPADLQVSQIIAASAFVEWTPVGQETTWELRWGPSGFNPDNSGTIVSDLTQSEYLLDGLENVTPYDVYVRAICDEEDISIWTGPASFSTICDIFTLPFTEAFDGSSIDCWSFPNGQGNWGFGSSYPPPSSVSGAPHATFNWSPSRVGYSFALTSPLLDATNLEETVKVDFILFLNNYNNNNLEQMSVEYKAFDADDWTTLETYTNEGIGGGNQEHVVTGLLIPGMQGQMFQVRFRAHGENSFSINGWSVDDVSVYQEIMEDCLAPTGITALLPTPSSIQISWTPQGNESSWEILYGEDGFDPETNGVLLENITETPYVIQDLDSSTAYHAYVKAVCQANYYSEWSGPVSFTTEPPSYTITITSEGPGETDPEETAIVEHGEDFTLYMDHVEGGELVDVLLNGTSVMEQVESGTDSPRLVLSNVTSDHHIHVIFALYQYELVVSAEPAEGGTVTGAGVYDHYEDVTVEAIPADGYEFLHWEDADGEFVASEEAAFTFMIPMHIHLVAHFREATSVPALTGPDGLTIYPNPAHDKLWIEFTREGQEELQIALYNMAGSKVTEQTISESGYIKTSLELEGILPG